MGVLGAELGPDAARRFFKFGFLDVFFQAFGLQSRRRLKMIGSLSRPGTSTNPAAANEVSLDLHLRQRRLEVSVDDSSDDDLRLELERRRMRQRLPGRLV